MFCFGLGYPTLNRYDPGKVPGTYDAGAYCDMVRAPYHLDYRAFVPWVARPFYLLAKGHIQTWDPALFGMLMANSILTAGAMVVLVAIGLRSGLPWATSLLAALLFLVDWVVPNLNLSAYVDSGELLCLVLLTWSMLSDRWYLIPLWAIPGSLSKETYAPFALIFAVTWWFLDRPLRWRRAGWIALAAVLGCLAVLAELNTPGNDGAIGFTSGMAAFQNVGLFPCIPAQPYRT